MAGNASTYLDNQIITHILRTATFNKPGAIAIALCSNIPFNTDNGGLQAGHEIANANAYARQLLNPADANWAATTYVSTSGQTQNSAGITFPVATSADWGWISGVAICDSGVWGTGNMLLFGSLRTPKYIGVGDQFIFNAGDIVLDVD